MADCKLCGIEKIVGISLGLIKLGLMIYGFIYYPLITAVILGMLV